MAVGQVGFKDSRKVKRVLVEARLNPIVNRLNKTKEERQPDLAKEKEDMEKEKRAKKREEELERVSSLLTPPNSHSLAPRTNTRDRRRRRLGLHERGRRRHISEIMCMMISSRRTS